MLCFAKAVRCLAFRTAQQIGTKLMHPCEKFRQNLLVKFHFMKDFDFLIHALKQKNFSLGFILVQNIRSLKPCHVLLKQQSENVFDFR